MRHGSFRAVRRVVFLLVILGLTGFSVFADENTSDQRSFIIDSFGGDTQHNWTYGNYTYSKEFEWAIDASKFATRSNNDTFPKMSYVDAWPQQLWGTNRDGRDIKSFGVWGKFDRRGYNWIDIYPAEVGSAANGEVAEPYEIPLPGRINSVDLWVWGSNHNFYIEAYFRDYQGVVHSINMGNLAYVGWRNLKISIPNAIRQGKRTIPHYAGLTFVKFRIWTTPMERVDNFYVYFNQLKVLTDTFETLYDGDELGNPVVVQQLWAQN